MGKNQYIGLLGEQYALSYLKKQGFTILKHHFTCQWGELDIIAQKGNTLAFIEVKTRIGLQKGQPYEAVTFYKKRSLIRAIGRFLQIHNLKNLKYSLDVISILLKPDMSVAVLRYFDNVLM